MRLLSCVLLSLIASSLYAANWECVEYDYFKQCVVQRMYFDEGWLVKATGYREYDLTFVPDPQHKWKLK